MENFNKSNPFIVISKKKYDSILDDIQLFGKSCIKYSFINILLYLCIFIVSGIYLYLNSSDINKIVSVLVINIFIIIINIIFIYHYRRKIKYFISEHPNMKEFDRISSLEVNDILALNNEDVLKCLNGLFELHGELKSAREYYSIFLKFIGLLEIVFSILVILNIIY